MSFNQRISKQLGELTYRHCESAEQLNDVYRLRGEAYRREGESSSSSLHDFEDEYDSAPNCANIGIYKDDELVAAIRIHLINAVGDNSICSTLFDAEIGCFLVAGRSIIETSRFVVSLDAAMKIKELPYLAMRLGVLACQHHNCKVLAFAIQPEHGAFYKKIYMAEQIGEKRFLAGRQSPVVLYAMDISKHHKSIVRKYPWLAPVDEGECDRIFGPSGTMLA